MAQITAQIRPIDLSTSALIVIDMQEHFREIAGCLLPSLIPIIDAFEEHNLPVIFTQHGHVKDADSSQLMKWWGRDNSIARFSPAWHLMSELEAHAPENNPKTFRIENKNRYDAFLNTDLEKILHQLQVDSVVVTGTMTNLCCETTARSAFNRDFYVYFPTDGNATLSTQMHGASILNLRYGFAQITTLDKIHRALSRLP
ncbi:Nicotinamidase 2 [Lipomyces tetrasporus]|uniref:Nicotinamidase 2 n=1 Tax=Lipomyces tetrasporus TaxID=54092 RepID=A0AAD7QR19_9ASCO|nr:Nicotinamidase 2 [Lipomyces tetrasporus]KAJ8099868.1 Nicotinamidase 2 [Lipomyces tetrasporus]